MDFGQLLHTAQRNEKSKDQRVKYYSTKFKPPKKEKKASSQLSENIKNFLAKKEAEERKKLEEAKQKRDELLALRSQDKKATKRVNVMLKRTKSANQSVIEDAVDKDNTAVTLAGPMQPDEDDYGYVSQEASQFYNKMMEKYSKLPDEPKFDMTKKKVSTNLGNTKDRVRAALEKEKEDALLPHKRKRKHKEKDEEEDGISYGAPDRPNGENSKDEKFNKEKMPPPPKPKPKMVPPPMNFADILKIAEKKQFEPIIIEKKEKEEERLLTKKQKREAEREKQSQIRREEMRREMLNSRLSKVGTKIAEKDKTGKEKSSEKQISKSSSKGDNCKSSNSHNGSKVDSEKSLNKPNSGREKSNSKAASKGKEEISEEEYIPGKYLPGDMRYRPELENKKPHSSDPYNKKRPEVNQNPTHKSSPIVNSNRKPQSNISQPLKKVPGVKQRESQYNSKAQSKNVPQKKSPIESQSKKFPPEDVRRKPPAKLPPKQFPPPDMKRRDERLGLGKPKKMAPVKRGRILDDDDSEYDSEMDDFIDDGDENEDYSKYISEIFGYDKARYKDMDDDVDNMETSFSQQMKEEVISAKIGIKEDLEEEKKEEEARRRKMMLKKKMRTS